MHRHVARYNRKAPTNHKLPYAIFNPHSGPAPLTSNIQTMSALEPRAESFIDIMSIDPGILNCGLRIERRRYIHNQLLAVETIVMVRINFNEENRDEVKDPQTRQFDTAYYTRSIKILDKFSQYFLQCQYILIESQLPINYSMVRMSQHLITYLCTKVMDLGNRPLIIEMDPHLKSRLLGAPGKMKKPELKKWSRTTALQILQNRDDNEARNAILKTNKGDDMSDTICQCEAWWIILCGRLHVPPLPVASPLLPINTNHDTRVNINIKHSIRLQINPVSQSAEAPVQVSMHNTSVSTQYLAHSAPKTPGEIDLYKKPPTVTIKIKQQGSSSNQRTDSLNPHKPNIKLNISANDWPATNKDFLQL
jgi:hypothetical protein